MSELPVIDVSPLLAADPTAPAAADPADAAAAGPAKRAVAEAIGEACRDSGFFYVSGHGVPPDLPRRLDAASRRFFALPEEVKAEISMERGGKAWRGFFPVGGELTSGRPDLKEGIYFGAEEPPGPLPLHGPNLFPAQVPELRDAVLDHLGSMTALAQAVMSGIALSLGLDEDYFRSGYTAQPTVLFRIFHYPPAPPDDPDTWGVGEHTDYGLLTLLLQDANGGLQVRTPRGWIEAPPLENTFVCNIGDMLDKLTGGHYRSTPHRVRNRSGNERLSFPFFFDPGWDSEVPPLPYAPGHRWDGQVDFTGTYGEYLLSKVSKVFPRLFEKL
ncbi:2-oxoglutarate and iron-dependent oxygenase domain-containing protein [Nonomuraea sp. NPDC049625]|uniref:isopenicillin N synthase family dioxygenase n=1 Tax=Nonomuraea sp. NPDC049625 TaxID=3155775 RepID=UPI003430CA3E